MSYSNFCLNLGANLVLSCLILFVLTLSGLGNDVLVLRDDVLALGLVLGLEGCCVVNITAYLSKELVFTC